ncbi:MAG: C39 family peptidase, partial [Ardenticatenaceae bacterium]
MGVIFGAAVVFIVSSTVFYLNWDYMPGRLRYLPRYIETNFLPERPHPEFVSTPVSAVAPEEALQRLQLAPVATPALADPAASAVQSAGPPVEGAQAPVTEGNASPAMEGEQSEPAAPVVPERTTVPLFLPPLASAHLEGLRHEYQGWNNCGPATLAMNLSFYGRPETQQQTAPFLKPDEDDKNVSPHEMAAYATAIGYGSKVVVGGSLELLRTFVSNGIPVIVESWFIPEPDDQMGHYLLLTGYEGNTLTFFDSYNGPDVRENAAAFDQLWKVFNRTAVVVWPPEQETLALAILGDLADPRMMYERALATAHNEVNVTPHDKFAWFNLGSNLLALGDTKNAVQAFD